MLTLSQLELIAAIVGVRLAETILPELHSVIQNLKVYLWSDSQIVLYWIEKGERTKNQFVSNRITTILEFKKTTEAGFFFHSHNTQRRTRDYPAFITHSRQWVSERQVFF